MVEALGAKVLKLVRTGIGGIEIDSLEIGKYRALRGDEVIALQGMRAAKKPSRSGQPGSRERGADAARDREPQRNGRSARAANPTRRRGRND